MGQRLGLHQEVSVTERWLVPQLKKVMARTMRGDLVIGMTLCHYRRSWYKCVMGIDLTKAYTPYSLRRGGATALFQHCSSFDIVMNKGRWASLSSCKLYVTTALSELASSGDGTDLGVALRAWVELLHLV